MVIDVDIALDVADALHAVIEFFDAEFCWIWVQSEVFILKHLALQHDRIDFDGLVDER